MSQEYAPVGGPSKSGSRPQTPERPATQRFVAPTYMTVGSGHTSEHAHRLAAMLDNDSGYGGSIADSSSVRGWDLITGEDRPTPPQTPERHSNNADGMSIVDLP